MAHLRGGVPLGRPAHGHDHRSLGPRARVPLSLLISGCTRAVRDKTQLSVQDRRRLHTGAYRILTRAAHLRSEHSRRIPFMYACMIAINPARAQR
jgi:hypothetical protein